MSGSESDPKQQHRACPICGKPQSPRVRPFCSPRCRDVDLNRWLTGSYAIPAEEPPDDIDAVENAASEDAEEPPPTPPGGRRRPPH